jgi:4-hydroxy-tetrahydrodipicolinate reductase
VLAINSCNCSKLLHSARILQQQNIIFMKLGILGANGRMGQHLIEATHLSQSAQLVAAVVRTSSSSLGLDAGLVARLGSIDIKCQSLDNIDPTLLDVMIDFTLPDALGNNVDWCVRNKKAMVIGTTGLDDAQFALMEEAAKDIPIFWAANYSLGINVMLNLASQAAMALEHLADIEIIEAHHKHKLDSPSGTAIAIGEAIATATQRNLDDCAIYGHQTAASSRKRSDIGFSVIRGGDIVGEHTALFACEGERLEITHKASTRMTFASGAVNAAVWLAKQAPGRYGMQDLIDGLVNK